MNNKKVGIVGLGYVGLPLATLFAERGFNVIAYDRDESKINHLKNSVSYIEDIPTERLSKIISKISPTLDPSDLSEADCISVCVPTPVTWDKKPDLKPIMGALEDIKAHVKEGAVVIIESTVYPNFTKEMARPLFPQAHVVFSSERVDPNNQQFEIKDIPKVLGADSEEALTKARGFYSELFTLKEVSSTAVAESSKLLENTYRAVNIALANDFSRMCRELDIDVWEVIDAAKTKPFGFQAFYPSLGVGGHCIPVDPFYLLHKADSRLVREAMMINQEMVKRCIYMAQAGGVILGGPDPKDLGNLKGKVLLLGVAYKPDISDYRESPSIRLLDRLLLLKHDTLTPTDEDISYYDPHVPSISEHGIEMTSQPSLEDALEWADTVLVCTAHSAFDREYIKSNSNILFDFCGLFRDDPNVEGV